MGHTIHPVGVQSLTLSQNKVEGLGEYLTCDGYSISNMIVSVNL